MHIIITRLLLAMLAAASLSACQESFRPQMTPVGQNLLPGQAGMNGQLVAAPITVPSPAKPAPGSLWVPGSRQFFKDSRARDVGDIITVIVSEQASASSNAKTDASRKTDQRAGITNLLNLNRYITRNNIPLDATGLVGLNSDRDFQGEGKTDRKDSLSASVAAVVMQVLPNGLLVIQGQREVLVNYEKQIMTLSGIVRPEDITAGNTIPSSKIAEARIAYAGQGVVDDQQSAQYGARFLDKVLPF